MRIKETISAEEVGDLEDVLPELSGEGMEVLDDEEFIRMKLVPVLNEMLRRNISGYGDGDYQYRIVRKKEEE